MSQAQQRNRRKNVALTLKNMSVLKMAEAHQPAVPVRLYKPLSFSRLQYMKKKLEQAREALGGTDRSQLLQQRARAVAGGLAGTASLLPAAAQAALATGS